MEKSWLKQEKRETHQVEKVSQEAGVSYVGVGPDGCGVYILGDRSLNRVESTPGSFAKSYHR